MTQTATLVMSVGKKKIGMRAWVVTTSLKENQCLLNPHAHIVRYHDQGRAGISPTNRFQDPIRLRDKI